MSTGKSAARFPGRGLGAGLAAWGWRFFLFIFSYGRVFHLKAPGPFFGFRIFFREAPVFVQETGECVAVDPDFVVPLFLGFVENKLQPPMEMDGLNVVDVFLFAVSGVPHVADHIPGSDHAPLFQVKGIGEVLAQVGVIIVPFAVKAADADAPAAVLVPAQGFHIAGLDGDDGCTYKNKI